MPRPSVVVPVVLVVVVALVAATCTPVAAAPGDAPPGAVTYRAPVEAEVVDHFDLPAQRWQPGNRGIDYGTAPAAPVVAAADGEVVFAGAVGGALHVTVRHPDGLRTSYSFLAEVHARVGQAVRAGDDLGTAGGPVHFGVRTPDGTYLDPEQLLAGTLRPRVRLVPGVEDGLDALAERRSLLGLLWDGGVAAATWAATHGEDALRLSVHYAAELDPRNQIGRVAYGMWEYAVQQLHCTSASAPAPPPAERRIAVVVSGLSTTSKGNSAWEIDTDALGYDAADVVRFSYRGGRAPGPGAPALTGDGLAPPGPEVPLAATVHRDPTLGDIPVQEFDGVDSQQDIELSAERLEALLGDVAAAEPGVPIDVIAHSQGGIVSRLAVVDAGDRGLLPPTVENLVTVGSPHQGAPMATGVVLAEQTPGGQAELDLIRQMGWAGAADDQYPAVTQLAETSPELDRMRALPVPDGVRFTAIGGSTDLVVPGSTTYDPQADTHVLLRTGLDRDVHSQLATDPRTTREIDLALTGRGPTCTSPLEAGLALGEAQLVRNTETVMSLWLADKAVFASPAIVVGEQVEARTGGGG